MMTVKQGLLRRIAVPLGVLLAPALIGLAAPASADPDPDAAAFLESLRAAGISYSGSADQVIATAKTVCRLIGSGKSGQDVLAVLQQGNPGLTVDHGSVFMGIAARSYCPNQLAPAG